MSEKFTLLQTDKETKARRGIVHTEHGDVQTPIFMPVGTQATVKTLTPQQIEDIGSQIILGNTYHLNLRPTSELIKEMGGLHQFMKWDKPILTDSGGFQVFSLSKLRKVQDDGVSFKSHLDGSPVFLGPKEALQIQENLGSDIAMVLDECPPGECDRESCAAAVKKTLSWAQTARDVWEHSEHKKQGNQLFGIVQGSRYEDMRQHCAEELVKMDFPGYAIGGVSVGEPEEELLRQVEFTAPFLPENKARYTMGVGTPPQLLKMIGYGVDMFDCVMPSRAARHGTVFTSTGKLNLKNERFKRDNTPIEEGLDNYAQNFSKSYLRHLIISQEILAPVLMTIHNLHFFLDLMAQARTHIEAGDFLSWSNDWIARYEAKS